mmetsp:Transcript_118727/g.343393  ORF Transcript_118727/g.343393 Transcript_118727/m.343393 type:complete len:80 (-) Transcript_118727:488-727(-)
MQLQQSQQKLLQGMGGLTAGMDGLTKGVGGFAAGFGGFFSGGHGQYSPLTSPSYGNSRGMQRMQFPNGREQDAPCCGCF